MLVRWLVGPLVGPSVGPYITLKTGYVAIASRRGGEGTGNQLMLKTGYVKIASRLVTVARSCFLNLNFNSLYKEKYINFALATMRKLIYLVLSK
jgi:hypothetical protein